MEQTAVIEEADYRDERRPREDSYDLPARGFVHRDQNREREPAINRHAAEKRNRLDVNFARPGLVHQADAQGEAAHRRSQCDRCQKRDKKRQQITVHRSFPSWSDVRALTSVAGSLVSLITKRRNRSLLSLPRGIVSARSL